MVRFVSTAGAALALAALLCTAATPAFAEGKISGVVNVNTASAAELEMLPGVGASRAKAVIEAREAKGGFKSLDDLLAVKGIGEASLAKLRPHLTLEGKTTVKSESQRLSATGRRRTAAGPILRPPCAASPSSCCSCARCTRTPTHRAS